MTKTEGNIRNRESSSTVTDIVWEIDAALTLLVKDSVLQSSTFSFRSHEWKLELQCVETSWGRKLFHVLSRKGSNLENDKGTIKWKAGILRSDGSEYETGNGEIFLKKNCLKWINLKTWVGHGFNFLVSEKQSLVPGGRLSIFLHLSTDPALELTKPSDDSMISEVNICETNSRNCPHSDVVHGVPNSRSFPNGDVPNEMEETGNSDDGKERTLLEKEGFGMTKIEGNIRNRESTSSVIDVVWEIDDALSLFGKDCALQSSTFSFRSHEWRLELQCVETSWGRRTFHVLSRKGSTRDKYKGIIKWKSGILRSDESEYDIANGETKLKKFCPMWDIETIWVGDNCKLLTSDSKWLLLEGRLSIYLRLSVDPSLELEEPRELAHVSVLTDFEDRSRDTIGREADRRDDFIVPEVSTSQADFEYCPHSDVQHGVPQSGRCPDGDVPHEVADTGNSAHENERPSLRKDGFAHMSVQTYFEDMRIDAIGKKADSRDPSLLSRFTHLSFQTDFQQRSRYAAENSDEIDDFILSDVNTCQANFGFSPQSDVQHRVANSGSFSNRDVPHEADTGNSAHESERPSLTKEDFERRSRDEVGMADEIDGSRISEVNTSEDNYGNLSPNILSSFLPNSSRFSNDDVPRDVADTGNSDQENERPSRKKKGAEKVIEDISSLLFTGDDSDVVVEVRGFHFRAHRAILCARIPVIASMFQCHSSETKTGVVLKIDCDPEAFREFLHYVYNGSPSCLTKENAFSIYALAYKYCVEDLKERCLKCIKDTLCVDSFVETALLALTYNEEELLQYVTSFFTDNISLILRRIDWQIFMKDHSTWANELLIKSQGPP